MSDLVTVSGPPVWMRLVLCGALLGWLVLTWFAVSWQVGDMLAEVVQPDDPNASSLADLAVHLAPPDPGTSRLKAAVDPTTALGMYEHAVRLAPADYRWRIELGRTLEGAGELDRAESELKTAVALAPAYGAPHWTLGNFYLRGARESEAMDEFRLAALNDRFYRDQVFSLLWEYTGKDARRLEDVAGHDAASRVSLSYFFAAHGRGDDAVRIWNAVPDSDKTNNEPVLRSMALGLLSQKVFPAALEFCRQAGFDPNAKFEAVTNPSFEQPFGISDEARFDWKTERSDPKLEIAADRTVAHDGIRSVKIVFKAYAGASLNSPSQLVAIKPASSYRLSFWMKTDGLRSSSLPDLEIKCANDGARLAVSHEFPVGTSDWKQLAITFNTPEYCDGVLIVTGRDACGEGCPISGTVWMDDFVLEKQ